MNKRTHIAYLLFIGVAGLTFLLSGVISTSAQVYRYNEKEVGVKRLEYQQNMNRNFSKNSQIYNENINEEIIDPIFIDPVGNIVDPSGIYIPVIIDPVGNIVDALGNIGLSMYEIIDMITVGVACGYLDVEYMNNGLNKLADALTGGDKNKQDKALWKLEERDGKDYNGDGHIGEPLICYPYPIVLQTANQTPLHNTAHSQDYGSIY